MRAEALNSNYSSDINLQSPQWQTTRSLSSRSCCTLAQVGEKGNSEMMAWRFCLQLPEVCRYYSWPGVAGTYKLVTFMIIERKLRLWVWVSLSVTHCDRCLPQDSAYYLRIEMAEPAQWHLACYCCCLSAVNPGSVLAWQRTQYSFAHQFKRRHCSAQKRRLDID